MSSRVRSRLFYEVLFFFFSFFFFETVKSKVILSLFETVRSSVSISLRNLYDPSKSIKQIALLHFSHSLYRFYLFVDMEQH